MVDNGDEHDVRSADTSLQVRLQEQVRSAAAAGDRQRVMSLLTSLHLEFPGVLEGLQEGVRRKSGSSPDATSSLGDPQGHDL